MLQRPGGFSGSRAPYLPSADAARRMYPRSYMRRPRFYPRLPPPPPPTGAGTLASILGPIGGLTGCFCCLNTIGVWGLFITAIPLTVFISRWLTAYKSRNGLNGAEELVAPHMLLLVVLVCSFMFTFMRRS